MAEIESTEAGRERPDSAAHNISQMLDDFNQRLTLSNPWLMERYIKRELLVFVEFRVWGIDEKFVACFQREKIIGRPQSESWASFQLLHQPRQFPHCGIVFGKQLAEWLPKVNADEPRADCEQQTVFVNDIEPMEHPEIVPLASFVRFGIAESI